MTPEEQEALSKKYVTPMVLRLEDADGLERYAVFGADRQLLRTGYWYEIKEVIDTYIPPAEVKRTAPAKRVTVTLTLEDLDL